MSDKANEAMEKLLLDTIDLYRKGILVQYGLTDEQALEIVANLTKLPKEKLQELKQKREDSLKEGIKEAFVSAGIQAGVDPKTAYETWNPEHGKHM